VSLSSNTEAKLEKTPQAETFRLTRKIYFKLKVRMDQWIVKNGINVFEYYLFVILPVVISFSAWKTYIYGNNLKINLSILQ
jgi:hypothetical protein